MAGTIIADYIRADANKLSFNVGNTIIASVNSAGILSNTGNVLINSSGLLEANSVYYNGSAVLSSGRVQRVNQPAGSVLQVVQTVKTDTFSMTGTTYTDVTGMSVSITPTSSSSKILVVASIVYGGNDYNFYCDLLRNSTVLNAPASGYNPCTISLATLTQAVWQQGCGVIYFLDSPSTTSSITYKLQIACQSAGTFYLNRSYRNGSNDTVSSSTITAMEIAG